MKKKSIRTNGINLAVYETGSDGTPIVLLHPGGIFGSYVWEQIFSRLSVSYRVIAIDIRGHGYSDHPMSGYEFNNLSIDILGIFDELNIQRAHIIGNSLGAEIGLVFASNFPERMLSLVQIDGGIINYLGPNGELEGTKEELVSVRLNRPIREFSSREEFNYFAKENFAAFDPIIEHIPLRILPNGMLTFQQDNQIAAELLASGCDLDMLALYKKASCPVLFFPAEKEPKLDVKLLAIDKIRSYLPACKTVIIPNSTHIMMIQHSAEICEEIEIFIMDSSFQDSKNSFHHS